MKNIFYIVFILNFSLLFSQNENSSKRDSIVWRKATCENGNEQAKIDFKNGVYNCFSYGLIFHSNPELSEFVLEYRKRKYGINTQNAGCVISEYTECYSTMMKNLVLKKFGNDIFEKSLNEAEELYKKRKQ